jgi:ATP-dependent RNA helicase SUPV3L1/SUV3
VARLLAGASLLHPELKLELPDTVPAGIRARVTRRLVAHVRDSVNDLLEPLHSGPTSSPSVRGVLYQLEQGLGTLPIAQLEGPLAALRPEERSDLHAHGVIVGRYSVYAPALLQPRRLALRQALCAIQLAPAQRKMLPEGELLIAERRPGIDAATYWALGFVPLHGALLRCDLIETLASEVLALPEHERFEELVRRLGGAQPGPRLDPERIQRILEQLARTRAGGKRRRRRRRRGRTEPV